MIDKRALKRWEKSNISYLNYQNYLSIKKHRFHISMIDLLYIANFKGGNATMNEPEFDLNNKLMLYQKKIADIHNEFRSTNLIDLERNRIDTLSSMIKVVFRLSVISSKHRIDGFNSSRLSALFNALFPSLIPILDRRVLINSGIVSHIDMSKQKQIIRIERFMKPLLLKTKETCILNKMSLRSVDKVLFIENIDQNIAISKITKG